MDGIRVKIKYLISFFDKTGKREETPVFPPGSDLNTAARWLESNYGIAVPAPGTLALLNGHGWGQTSRGMNTPLVEGDVILLMPSISGG